MKKRGHAYKHGLRGTWCYSRWKSIRRRCYSTKYKEFHYYGGRGIVMCDEWKNDAKAFCDYIKSLPEYDENNVGRGKLTIDRIDNNGNYEPGNVRLVNCHVQAANQRMYSCNTTGFRGVSKRGNKFIARIRVNKKLIHLGSHETPEQANESRLKYIKEHNLIEYL